MKETRYFYAPDALAVNNHISDFVAVLRLNGIGLGRTIRHAGCAGRRDRTACAAGCGDVIRQLFKRCRDGMRRFYIALFDHCILQGRIYPLMSE